MPMKRVTSLAIAFVFAVQSIPSEAQSSQPPSTQANKPAVIKAAPTKPTLEDGTPVKLRLSENISSADAHAGQTVNFEVLEEIQFDGITVIPKGGIAWATVTEAEHKKSMGRAGKLNVNIDSVRLVDGEKVALRAVQSAKGGGHVGAMTGAIVATSIVFFPAAPLFLFIHGKDITIPKGTEITAFINGDVLLDLAKLQPSSNTPATTVAAAPSGETKLNITSTPEGAEIELDGNFSGDTPSTVTVPPGDHTIRITKAGYVSWERKMRTTSGDVKIAVALEQQVTPAPNTSPAPSAAPPPQ